MNVTFQIDPLNKFDSVEMKDIRLAALMGVLPIWALSAKDDETIQEAFDRQYAFGLFPMTGETLSDEGVFSYPEDPDMYPVGKLVRTQEAIEFHNLRQKRVETVYFYQHAIVSIVTQTYPLKRGEEPTTTVFTTRMD